MKSNRIKKSATAKTAMLAGAGLTLAGLTGFLLSLDPQYGSSADLGVDSASNSLYFISGVAGLFASSCGKETSRAFFRFCTVVYGILAIMAIFYVEQPNFGWLTNDAFHASFHFSVAAISFLFGFGTFSLQAPNLPLRFAQHRPRAARFRQELIHR